LEIRIQDRSVDTTEMMKAPRNAGTNPSTVNSIPSPRPSQAASMSIRAFTTSVNKPSVSSMIGQLTSFRKGRTKAFTRPKTSASARIEPIPPARMPGTNEAATLCLYVTGASVAALGPTRTALLVPSILAATATLVLVAALLRRIRPELPIGIALLVPASSLWLFHSGEVGLRASAAPLVLLGACFLLDDRAEENERGRTRAEPD